MNFRFYRDGSKAGPTPSRTMLGYQDIFAGGQFATHGVGVGLHGSRGSGGEGHAKVSFLRCPNRGCRRPRHQLHNTLRNRDSPASKKSSLGRLHHPDESNLIRRRFRHRASQYGAPMWNPPAMILAFRPAGQGKPIVRQSVRLGLESLPSSLRSATRARLSPHRP